MPGAFKRHSAYPSTRGGMWILFLAGNLRKLLRLAVFLYKTPSASGKLSKSYHNHKDDQIDHSYVIFSLNPMH